MPRSAPASSTHTTTLLRDAGAQDLVTKRGRLFVWSTEAGWHKDQYGLAIRRQRGIHLDELSGDQVREMEPALGPIVRRGVYAPNAGHIVNPHRLVTTLAALLREKGGEIRRESVRTIEFAGDGKPVVVTDQGRREADQVVLAAGVWSRDFAAPARHQHSARRRARLPRDDAASPAWR